MTSVDQKPLTTDQANEFAKRQVRLDIGRQGAEAIAKSALADAKFEGDYARIMTAATPAARNADARVGWRRPAWRDTGACDGGRHAGNRDSERRKPKGAAEELIG